MGGRRDVVRGSGALGAGGFDQHRATLVRQKVPEELGVGDVTGGDDVRRDAFWAQFGGQIEIPRRNCCFGSAVRSSSLVGGNRSDGDDGTATGASISN